MKRASAETGTRSVNPRASIFLTWVLRHTFDLLYNRMAWVYEAVACLVSLGQWSTWRLSAAAFLQPGSVLEIGHGTGDLALKLGAQGWNVVALDLSANMGRLARHRLNSGHACGGRTGTIRLVRANALQLPFRECLFDNLVSTFPTEFIFRFEAISEARRVLRPGGRWIVIPLAQLATGGVFRRLLAGLFQITGQVPAWDTPLGEILRANGFLVLQEVLTLPTSYVHVTVATKPEAAASRN